MSNAEYLGCSDGGCIFGHPGGMHTNGGCHCVPSLSTFHTMTANERLELRNRSGSARRRTSCSANSFVNTRAISADACGRLVNRTVARSATAD